MTYDPWAEPVYMPEAAVTWAALAERMPDLLGVHLRVAEVMWRRASPMHPTTWAAVVAEVDALPLTMDQRCFVLARLGRTARVQKPRL